MTDCECPLIGWCERHKMNKSAHLHNLCKTSAKHRAHWDANAGLPPIAKQAKNVSQAILKWTAAGFPVRTKAERKALLEICKKCEHYIAEKNRCSKCGCYLKQKIKMATEACPCGHW